MVLSFRVSINLKTEIWHAYMKATLVKEDVVLLMILLQQLANLPRTVLSQPLDVELGLLRRLKIDLRTGRHILYLPGGVDA
jgi:hypothetical protein